MSALEIWSGQEGKSGLTINVSKGYVGIGTKVPQYTPLLPLNTQVIHSARFCCTFCGRWRSRDIDQCKGCGATEVEGEK